MDSDTLTSHCNKLNNIIENLLVNQDTIQMLMSRIIQPSWSLIYMRNRKSLPNLFTTL